MQKTLIRAQMKQFLAGITPEERHRRSLAACRLLSETKHFRNAQLIMMFLSMDSEIETSTIALAAWKEGKSIAVPRTDWETRRMDPVEINSLETNMQTAGPGTISVREPVGGKVVPLDMIDLVVVPGLAFDRKGYRVGRGKGFYDRFLARKEFKGARCALCYHEQVIDSVPYEPHDMPMHLIVTDRETIYSAGGGAQNVMRSAGQPKS